MAWKNAVLSRSEQREMKREVLLREAAAAINKRGFHATSLEDIASSLAVSKAALYYYFPNKQKLLAACLERVMQAAFEGMAEAEARGRTGREKVKLALQLYLRKMIDEMSCCVVVTEESSLLPEDRIPHLAERDRYDRRLREMIQEGIDDGSIVPCDPKLVAFTLLGAVHWVPKWFSHSGPWSSAQLSAAMTDLMERALSTKPVSGLATSVTDLPGESPAAAAPSQPKGEPPRSAPASSDRPARTRTAAGRRSAG